MTKAKDVPLASPNALKRLKKRRAADRRFRFYGLAAVAFALSALAILISAIGVKAMSAATYHVLSIDVTLDPNLITPDGDESPEDIVRNIEGFYSIVRRELDDRFPEVVESRAARLQLNGILARLAVLPLARRVADNPGLVGQTIPITLPVSDDMDLFLKGSGPEDITVQLGRAKNVDLSQDGQVILQGGLSLGDLTSVLSALDAQSPSILLSTGSVTGRLMSAKNDSVELEMLTGAPKDFVTRDISAHIIPLPEIDRPISDQQIAWALSLRDSGAVRRVLHTSLLTQTDSTYPELAGALAAIVGSLLVMLVTGTVAIPIGIFAAIYLEEFAPKNRLTNLIEVNINNLAAVPSIVFGLLGASLLLGAFGLPRSVPLVGGLVLALLILPIVIIAARASLRSVPPSIRSAALAVGASRMQAVFHHVLPLAAPGMLTGAILGMARALGETAPLLLIGMVAFVAEVPTNTTDEATTLPVLIYTWSTNAERSWEPMTAAAIVILLSLLVIMNAIVVLLRRRFERRW